MVICALLMRISDDNLSDWTAACSQEVLIKGHTGEAICLPKFHTNMPVFLTKSQWLTVSSFVKKALIFREPRCYGITIREESKCVIDPWNVCAKHRFAIDRPCQHRAIG